MYLLACLLQLPPLFKTDVSTPCSLHLLTTEHANSVVLHLPLDLVLGGFAGLENIPTDAAQGSGTHDDSYAILSKGDCFESAVSPSPFVELSPPPVVIPISDNQKCVSGIIFFIRYEQRHN